jgi:cytidylate kinase
MNILFYGNTGCGKSTLAETICKRYPYFKHVNTGALTRMMASFGCKNLPLLVQDMIKSMSPIENHIFDHFYTHTWEQLNDLFDTPYVVAVEDKRTNKKPVDEMKHNRFLAQAHEVHRFMIAHHIVPIKVYNTDYGFDVSELIKADILPFDEFAVLRPGQI